VTPPFILRARCGRTRFLYGSLPSYLSPRTLGWLIEKEDKRFFVPTMGYFSREEKDEMLARGMAVDRSLFHQEYEDLVTALSPADESVKNP
jgi:hypothetical protein